MADIRCGNCGSPRTNALADAVGCDDCGAATGYDGELRHGPTGRDFTSQPIPGTAGEDDDTADETPEKKAASKRTSAKSTKKG